MPNPEQILLNGRQLGWMSARPLVGNEDVESFFRHFLEPIGREMKGKIGWWTQRVNIGEAVTT